MKNPVGGRLAVPCGGVGHALPYNRPERGGERSMKDGAQDPGFEIVDHPLKEENRQIPAPYTRSSALMPGPVTKKGTAPEPVKFTIDGRAVSVPAGTLLIEAAKQVGIEIPSYCYYPNLTLQGACRMCLVAVERMPKLQTACTTVVTNG